MQLIHFFMQILNRILKSVQHHILCPTLHATKPGIQNFLASIE